MLRTTRFRIDPERSEVRIDAAVNGRPVHGRMPRVEGFVDLALRDDRSIDPAVASGGELILPVSDVRGRNPLETRQLRRRIHVGRFPAIGARLESLREDSIDGVYVASGQVTIRGRSRPAQDLLRLTFVDAGALRIGGAHGFDLREYGVDPPQLPLLRVDPTVRVTVDLTAWRSA